MLYDIYWAVFSLCKMYHVINSNKYWFYNYDLKHISLIFIHICRVVSFFYIKYSKIEYCLSKRCTFAVKKDIKI